MPLIQSQKKYARPDNCTNVCAPRVCSKIWNVIDINASAPRIFTKLQKPVFSWLIHQGIRCCYYIDDSLCMNQEFDCCQKNSKIITDKLDQLGFTMNQKNQL